MSILTTRKHDYIAEREKQLRRNALAVNGGRPYIDERLWRAPNETDVSWNGDPARCIVGRRERASLVNDCGRVASKINQYIFKSAVTRDGIGEAFEKNCTGDGQSIGQFMADVCTSITYGGWCWIQIDRAPLAIGEDGSPVELTLDDKTGIRLIKWDAVDVPDWRLNAAGQIEWLLTRSSIYDNSDPRQPTRKGTITTLYELIEGHVYVTEEAEGVDVECRQRVEIPGMKAIPFVLVGKPSNRAWWFDDLENIQAQNLNLDSSHNETLMESVYPQMVLPMSLVNSLETKLLEDGINGEKVLTLVRELTVGRRTPVIESGEDKGISRYIAPGGDLKLLTDEITRKRSLLFDIAGLALMNRETRQVQTAEAKAFDQLDTSSTLGNRAMLLQEAEKRIVDMAKVFDPTFEAWDPVYPCKFDVVDVAALSQAVTMILNLPDIPPKLMKVALKCTAKILKEIAAVSEDELEEVNEAIDELPDERPQLAPNPFARKDDEDEEEDEDEDEEDGPQVRVRGFAKD